ncbi:hypothetical protein V7087_00825 [Neobacillus niacini]|uniref:hypothetical protein n=1 Tax=Neobacillus niacini TaxID=86668 RepID=UPI002FFDF6AB
MIKRFLFYLMMLMLQFSVIILAIVLEDLSSEKMGVARYLLFKKQEFEASFFTPILMNLYTSIFVIGTIICLSILMIKGKSRKIIISILFATIANLVGIIFIRSNWQLAAYHFFLIGIFIVIAFQYVGIVFSTLKRSPV